MRYKSNLFADLSDTQLHGSPSLLPESAASAGGGPGRGRYARNGSIASIGVSRYPEMANIPREYRDCPCSRDTCFVKLYDEITLPLMGPGRVESFESVLNQPEVNIEHLRTLSNQGIPAPIRGMVWQILLGYLPAKASFRESILHAKRTRYSDLVKSSCGDSFVLPYVQMKPLLNETAQLIRVDVERTRPDGYVKKFSTEEVMQSLSRVLLVWSVQHPAVGYFQGLNDLVCPLLIVFIDYHMFKDRRYATDDYNLSDSIGDGCSQYLTPAVLALAEADAYWCLCAILDSLFAYVEKSKCGVHAEGMMIELDLIMNQIDSPLMDHLEAQGVELVHFAFRWMLCLFIRELHMDLLIPLWDFYIAYPRGAKNIATTPKSPSSNAPLLGDGFSHLHVYVCAAFLRHWSADVVKKEFMGIVQFLQNPPAGNWGRPDLETLIKDARTLTNNHKI
eukprot:TRINITY_DN5844_c0_g1_i6.p1 TRINITY_DN5844_c0_g1~~TRINITY_DN5844_c0_g1_i6.p1  ORF type:complete len:448 (+),score=63.05 TRINITY_DN5844_c0_g1_i6:191-1534(+)